MRSWNAVFPAGEQIIMRRDLALGDSGDNIREQILWCGGHLHYSAPAALLCRLLRFSVSLSVGHLSRDSSLFGCMGGLQWTDIRSLAGAYSSPLKILSQPPQSFSLKLSHPSPLLFSAVSSAFFSQTHLHHPSIISNLTIVVIFSY